MDNATIAIQPTEEPANAAPDSSQDLRGKVETAKQSCAELERRVAELGTQAGQSDRQLGIAQDKLLSGDKNAEQAATTAQAKSSALNGALDKAKGLLSLRRETLQDLQIELDRAEVLNKLKTLAEDATAQRAAFHAARASLNESLKADAACIVIAREAQIRFQSDFARLMSEAVPGVNSLLHRHDSDKQKQLDALLCELQGQADLLAVRENLNALGSYVWNQDAHPQPVAPFERTVQMAYSDFVNNRDKNSG
jgi:predicted  nucleic acid-binding Zn-ribbon protein